MKSIPIIYWKLHNLLKQDGLDDSTLASKFRLTREDVRDTRHAINNKRVRKNIEWWFGKEPKQLKIKKKS